MFSLIKSTILLSASDAISLTRGPDVSQPLVGLTPTDAMDMDVLHSSPVAISEPTSAVQVKMDDVGFAVAAFGVVAGCIVAVGTPAMVAYVLVKALKDHGLPVALLAGVFGFLVVVGWEVFTAILWVDYFGEYWGWSKNQNSIFTLYGRSFGSVKNWAWWCRCITTASWTPLIIIVVCVLVASQAGIGGHSSE